MTTPKYYYTEAEWARLGVGPLPKERDLRYKDMNYQDINWSHNLYPVYPDSDPLANPNPYGEH